MDSAFILKLIRHAPTAGNKAKKYIGWTDEAVVPFQALPDFTVQEIWGSDLQRCRQTADQLFPAAQYRVNPDWRECYFGSWEGKTYAQLEYDETYQRWLNDPNEVAPPGGERLSDVAERVNRAVRALPHGKEHIVITHGGPIRLLLKQGNGGSFWEQPARHGICYTLTWNSRKECEEGARCISYSAAPITASGSM
ncbi:histidine phosphatase family protein [Planococcus lenghuensis]|uniref:Histidine phosphatase family protein n=1 Tax=Planococcus lenghuensis TaxID=2213202 RepID=A0A1Q2L1K4_9BACL|nr:histidine phosphatase family protein [Planococcus lenghuensis]AQQ54311.1 histidine phosphatase family protein [Planococcus lenghuensis]